VKIISNAFFSTQRLKQSWKVTYTFYSPALLYVCLVYFVFRTKTICRWSLTCAIISKSRNISTTKVCLLRFGCKAYRSLYLLRHFLMKNKLEDHLLHLYLIIWQSVTHGCQIVWKSQECASKFEHFFRLFSDFFRILTLLVRGF
jgi:hypothetical protein